MRWLLELPLYAHHLLQWKLVFFIQACWVFLSLKKFEKIKNRCREIVALVAHLMAEWRVKAVWRGCYGVRSPRHFHSCGGDQPGYAEVCCILITARSWLHSVYTTGRVFNSCGADWVCCLFLQRNVTTVHVDSMLDIWSLLPAYINVWCFDQLLIIMCSRLICVGR